MNERKYLENEINELRYELSVTIPQEMQNAIESGDLKENSEFSEVISRQYFASIRLQQLIDRLNTYKAINLQNVSKTNVGVGSIVEVNHLEENKIVTFKLVLGAITDAATTEYVEVTSQSPIGKALCDKQVGETGVASLPKGKATYKIISIKTLHDQQP
jgi:transcription elongation factor GreA